MAGTSSRLSGAITSINVTPLVDITLVLLIVFMVTARLIVDQRSIGLDLPKAASGEGAQVIFAVELFSDGRVRVNGAAAANDEAVLELAHQARHATRELRAAIHADGSVPHRRVVAVLDRLRLAGITKIAFGVVPPPEARVAEPGR